MLCCISLYLFVKFVVFAIDNDEGEITLLLDDFNSFFLLLFFTFLCHWITIDADKFSVHMFF